MTFSHLRRLVRGLNRFHDICLGLSLVLAGSLVAATLWIGAL